MTQLRPIAPINIADLDTAQPETGEPICERVDPRALFVDPTYQRDIGERGLRQIRRIIEAWSWTKFKPPICAYSLHDGKTVLKVVDGQHTAIAAASHPDVGMIPVMIIEASDTATQAEAFVGQNTQRVGITPLQLHYAALVAQDEDALTVAQVCQRAGVTILRTTPKTYQPRQTVAVTAISTLIDRRGAMKARQILEVLANAELKPITATHIRAVELLLTDEEYRDAITAEDLTVTVAGEFDDEAKLFASTHRVPIWRGLASVWFRNTKKKRGALKAVA